MSELLLEEKVFTDLTEIKHKKSTLSVENKLRLKMKETVSQILNNRTTSSRLHRIKFLLRKVITEITSVIVSLSVPPEEKLT